MRTTFTLLYSLSELILLEERPTEGRTKNKCMIVILEYGFEYVSKQYMIFYVTFGNNGTTDEDSCRRY